MYHSSFVSEDGIVKACGCPLLPLKSHIKGPTPVSDQDQIDIVDESINVALKRLEGCRTLAEGTKAIINLGLEKVPVPRESGFPFGGLFCTSSISTRSRTS